MPVLVVACWVPWGYIGRDGSPCLQYCHNCQLENYAMNIPTGQCTWCAAGPSEPVHGHEPALAPETQAYRLRRQMSDTKQHLATARRELVEAQAQGDCKAPQNLAARPQGSHESPCRFSYTFGHGNF